MEVEGQDPVVSAGLAQDPHTYLCIPSLCHIGVGPRRRERREGAGAS